jgi:hypothetical protein
MYIDVDYYPALQKEGNPAILVTYINRVTIMLGEISQSQKGKYYDKCKLCEK